MWRITFTIYDFQLSFTSPKVAKRATADRVCGEISGQFCGDRRWLVGPCPASFVATILNFFPKVVGPSPVFFSRNQKRYLKPNLDVFLNLTKWFLCSRASATEGEVLPCFSTLSVMTYFVCSHCVVSPTTFNFTAAAAFRTSQTMLCFQVCAELKWNWRQKFDIYFTCGRSHPPHQLHYFPTCFKETAFPLTESSSFCVTDEFPSKTHQAN